jgi:hypothetical protein
VLYMVTYILCGSFQSASDVMVYYPFYGAVNEDGEVIL